ncbi:MAG TPA: hypothetical protein VFD70_25110 [Anaerolineae bacterium]|nr:hypothetical protein [Anaerolineae bacterium]
MNETLDYLNTFARFPFALRRFLLHRLTLAQAKQTIHERMEHREENFLKTLETSIYGHPSSPYLALLKRADCELGDVRALVKRQGLEAALRELREEGVYVTFEEFKGRKPIVRSSLHLPVKASDFDNPFVHRVFDITTGGSTGAAVSVGVDLDQIMASAPHEMVALAAFDLLHVPEIRWNGILPTGTPRTLLRAAYIGRTPVRWFVPGGLRDSKYWVKYTLATYYLIFWMRAYGLPIPMLEYLQVDQAIVVARAISEILAKQGRCLLQTNISRSVRVSLAAQQAGIDLRGAIFRGGAEPATPAKVEQIERAGVPYLSNYGTVESSRIGAKCAHPADITDVHLMRDAFVLFTHPYPVEGFGVEVPAFNLTTLLPTAPKIMLNYQMDDYGIVEERHCGCELESYGFMTHLREIHSYGKLTGEGVTLIGTEVQNILERVLPARFGGSSLDYQLMEQEDAQGFTRLYLVISPRIEIADEQAVVNTLLQALSASSSMADAARTVWQQSQTIQVKRMEPALTGRGKLMPLHITRRMQTQ